MLGVWDVRTRRKLLGQDQGRGKGKLEQNKNNKHTALGNPESTAAGSTRAGDADLGGRAGGESQGGGGESDGDVNHLGRFRGFL